MLSTNLNLHWTVKQKGLLIMTCYDSVAKTQKWNIFGKFIPMIDEWKKVLNVNDPFFFLKLDNNNFLYKFSKYRFDQASDGLVLVYDFFLSNFDFVFLRFFCQILFKSFSKSMQCKKTFFTITRRGGSNKDLFG